MSPKFAAAALPLALILAGPGLAAAEVRGEKVERIAPDRVAVSWTDSGPVDVYMTDSADAPLSKARLVSDDDADGRFETAASPIARPYFLLRESRGGKAVRVAERALPLAQGSNFRDLGGYPAAGGKRVRWGQIYRSGATAMLTPQDVAAVKALGITEMVDLRSTEERVLAPTKLDGVRYSAIGYSMLAMLGDPTAAIGEARMRSFYAQFPTFLAPQMKLVFQELLEKQGAVAYNCSAGQDRTGFTTGLVLSALGVPRDVIFADYHLSTTYRRPQYEMPRISAAMQAENPIAGFFASTQQSAEGQTAQPLFDSQQQPYLKAAFDAIDARWGSVDAYLDKELGVGPADIAQLRRTYLE